MARPCRAAAAAGTACLLFAAACCYYPATRRLETASRSLRGATAGFRAGCAAVSPRRIRGVTTTRASFSATTELQDSEFLVETPERAAELLNKGAVGVIPTDTSYAFVCKLGNKEGVERMYKIKEPTEQGAGLDDLDESLWQTSWKKGMSLLCKDIAQIQAHTDQFTDRTFKTLKKCLPGPYTFILPTTNKLPKFVIEHNNQKRVWKRKEVGVRIPDNDILKRILQDVDEPLVCTSVPFWSSPEVACSLDDLENTWCSKVDFVMAQEESLGSVSTIVDLTSDKARVLRQGKGSLEGIDL